MAPAGITAGPDGALWFTNSAGNSIGRITTKGEVTNYAAAGVVNPIGITGRAGRSLWFTDSYNPGSFGLISTSGRIIIHTSAEIDDPVGITTGPDGDVWMTNAGTRTSKGSIGRLTTNGRITVFTDPGLDEPSGLTVGPDKALWFTNYGGNSIGRITTSGSGRLFSGSGIDEPDSITAGPDGALWFTNYGDNSIGRITTSGQITNFTGAGIDGPVGITAGPDGGPVVRQLRQQFDRADHHEGKGHQFHRRRPWISHRRSALQGRQAARSDLTLGRRGCLSGRPMCANGPKRPSPAQLAFQSCWGERPSAGASTPSIGARAEATAAPWSSRGKPVLASPPSSAMPSARPRASRCYGPAVWSLNPSSPSLAWPTYCDLCSASWGHSPSHKQPRSGARWPLGHPSPVTRWR